jgi:hypothetical protein
MGIKLKDIFKVVKIGAGIAQPFVPGAVGTALDVVTKNLPDSKDPQNTQSLLTLAEQNDEQTAAILALHERVKILEEKIKKLESRS